MKNYDYGNLSGREILNIMREQKHDSLNILQVILGYLQLGKNELAQEYTREAIQHLQKNGEIMKINSTNLALLVLQILNEANNMGIESKCEVDDELKELQNESEVCFIIDDLWKTIQGQLLRTSINDRKFNLIFKKIDNSYHIVLDFSCVFNQKIFYKELNLVREWAEFYDMQLSLEEENNASKITLVVKY